MQNPRKDNQCDYHNLKIDKRKCYVIYSQIVDGVDVDGLRNTPEGESLQGRLFEMESINSLTKETYCTRIIITRGKVI